MVYEYFKNSTAAQPKFHNMSAIVMESYSTVGVKAISAESSAYPHRSDNIIVYVSYFAWAYVSRILTHTAGTRISTMSPIPHWMLRRWRSLTTSRRSCKPASRIRSSLHMSTTPTAMSPVNRCTDMSHVAWRSCERSTLPMTRRTSFDITTLLFRTEYLRKAYIRYMYELENLNNISLFSIYR